MRRILFLTAVLGILWVTGAQATSWTATPTVAGLEATYAPGGVMISGVLGPGPYLVVGASHTSGERWLRLTSPWRPGMGEAWVQRESVTLARTERRVVVDRAHRVVRLFVGRSVVARYPATIGAKVSYGRGAVIRSAPSGVQTSIFARQGEGARIAARTQAGPYAITVSPAHLAQIVRRAPAGTPFVIR